jgi:hypothetical protein
VGTHWADKWRPDRRPSANRASDGADPRSSSFFFPSSISSSSSSSFIRFFVSGRKWWHFFLSICTLLLLVSLPSPFLAPSFDHDHDDEHLQVDSLNWLWRSLSWFYLRFWNSSCISLPAILYFPQYGFSSDTFPISDDIGFM